MRIKTTGQTWHKVYRAKVCLLIFYKVYVDNKEQNLKDPCSHSPGTRISKQEQCG